MKKENENFARAEIITMQGSEASQMIDMIADKGEEYVIEVLKQWDSGEYHQVNTDIKKLANYYHFESGRYLLTWHSGHEFISLDLYLTREDFNKITHN